MSITVWQKWNAMYINYRGLSGWQFSTQRLNNIGAMICFQSEDPQGVLLYSDILLMEEILHQLLW